MSAVPLPSAANMDSLPGWRGGKPFEPRIAPARAAIEAAHQGLGAAIAALPYDRLEQQQTPKGLVTPYTPLPVDLSGIDASVRPAYKAGALLWQMERFEARFAAAGLPGDFHAQFVDSFHRILDQIEAGLDWIDATPDVFAKDLAITRLRLLPAGARLIHPFVGVPRGAVLKGGFASMRYVFGRCGGAAPFFGWHTHDPTTKAYFNPQGFAVTCRLTAALVASEKRARGVVGTSWFHDPVLDEISPRLAFLRAPVQLGAHLLNLGPSADATRLATTKSQTRRALVEQGKYMPQTYALIWSRRDLLAAYS